MDFQEIINQGELIYASKARNESTSKWDDEDRNLRKWTLKEYQCKVCYYQKYPLDEIDLIIAGILQSLPEHTTKSTELATLLGFNVYDDFESEVKHYKDTAEIAIYENLLKRVLEWGLIDFSESDINEEFIKKNCEVRLTALGDKSLFDNCKYQFFSGSKKLYENTLIPLPLPESKFFPFYNALGIFSEIEYSRKIAYDKIVELQAIFNPQDIEPIQKHKLQSNKEFNIYSSSAGVFNFISVDTDIRLYYKDMQYYPIVFFNGKISNEATRLLNSPENTNIKDIKIEWGLYLKVLNDPNAILDYKTLFPFLDILNLNNLIEDVRLVWSDDKLFKYLASQANAYHWHRMSETCPANILERYLSEYKENFEWNTLSLRINNEFIFKHTLEYPWNFELLISKENISAEDIKMLLLNKDLKDIAEFSDDETVNDKTKTRYIEWDWDIIMPLLDKDFILSNISNIHFDLTKLTQDLEPDKYYYIAQYPTKRWDWNYISSNFNLSFILDNITEFASYLNVQTICNRAFTTKEFIEPFCLSSEFKSVIENLEHWSLIGFSANDSKYLWTDLLIATLKQIGLITWKSSGYTSGFECNPYLEWDEEFFDKYHSEIQTEQGFEYVSQKVLDENTLNKYPDFLWDWEILSANDIFNSSISFIETYREKINLKIILNSVSWDVAEAIFDMLDVPSFLNKNPELWSRMTQIATKEFILDRLEYSWNWSILTHRFCNTINVKFLGNTKWIEKWDWEYLSKNMDITQIQDNLNSYAHYWDWNSISRRISSEFITQNLDTYPDYWDWEYLSRNMDIIQIQNNLTDYVQYWDWNTISSRISTEFITQNLGTYADYWDWEYLSKKLDNECIEDNLGTYTRYWNWSTITERAAPEFVIKNLDLYKKYWNWSILLDSKFQETHLLKNGVLQSIAQYILSADEELRFFYWAIITRKFSIDELQRQIAITYNATDFFWDYKYLYNHHYFNGKKYLEESTQYVNWKEFSTSTAANNMFVFDSKIFNEKAWIKRIVSKLLNNPSFIWDYKGLSQLTNINSNHGIFTISADKWDWDYISEFGSCFQKNEDFEGNFYLHIDHINFALISKRIDSGINEYLIEQNLDKSWDWNILATNPSVVFSFDFIFKHLDKPWNLGVLSDRADINWNIITKYSSFDWDWGALSKNTNLKLTNKAIIESADKPWDWKFVSIRTDIQFDEDVVSSLIEKPLDWYLLSQNKSFISNDSVLSIIEGKWDLLDWNAISQNIKDDLLSVQFLNKYKFRLNWPIINKQIDINITEQHLEVLFDVLNWDKASKSQAINYTSILIDKYRRYWNWSELRDNPKIIESGLMTGKYKEELNCADFIEQFPDTAYIYHFAHLFTAINIIKERKILSRNKGEGKFDNAAGNLVARRDTAHDYARFYYRPKTPTQFYNECLGKDSSDEYYQRAINLGLPKCPIPVFFKFDLKEVLTRMPDRCYYSTGNMQTNWASVIKVSENPNRLSTHGLYYNMDEAYNYAKMNCGGYNPQYFNILMSQYKSDCKQYSQQEFLVIEEFDFSELDSFEIICYNDEYANLLKLQLHDDPLCEKINANGWNIFHRKNRELLVSETETEICVTSEYRGSAYLSLKGNGLNSIQILSPENVQKETETEIIAYPGIRFTKTDQPIEVHFVDMTVGKRDWLIYKSNTNVNT